MSGEKREASMPALLRPSNAIPSHGLYHGRDQCLPILARFRTLGSCEGALDQVRSLDHSPTTQMDVLKAFSRLLRPKLASPYLPLHSSSLLYRGHHSVPDAHDVDVYEYGPAAYPSTK